MAVTDLTATFRESYCDRVKIAPEQFEATLFWRCLPWWKRPPALLVRWVWARAFAPDFAVLRECADAHSLFQVNLISHDLRRTGPDSNRVRDLLRLRISGRRLLEQASPHFEGE